MGLGQRLREQYQRVYALKFPDVEEWIDVVWHRRLAALLAMVLLPTPIGPNLVTLGSLLLGVAATGTLIAGVSQDDPTLRIIAALLALGAVVFDCADGQIARAKGGGSRWGRILDGIVDFAVLLGLYVTMWWATLRTHGWGWATVAFVGGWSGGLRIWSYDKLKSVYLSFVSPSASDGGESFEQVRAQWEAMRDEANIAQKFGMSVYLFLLRSQNAIIGGPEQLPDLDEDERAAFRARHIGVVRQFTVLGLGTHMAFIYAAIALSAIFEHAFEVLHVFFLVPYNLYYLWVLRRSAPMRRGS